jgi:hypoxanthine phosphoribosyltransferase
MSASAEGNHGLYGEVLIDEATITGRIDELAGEVIHRYDPNSTIFVSLLNGAQPFASLLMFAIARQKPDFHPNIQSMIISRYGSGREGGAPELVTDLPPQYRELTGLTAVVVDDLLDGGGTYAYARKVLLGYGAAAVDMVTLGRKKKDPSVSVEGNLLVGFDDLPDVWLTGMGMDDTRITDEANRWFAGIAIANS